jgi:hypothetical protein
MESGADLSRGPRDAFAVSIAIAEYEMRVRGKQTHRGVVANIAAMDDELDASLRHDLERALNRSCSIVRVADDGD